VFIKVIPLPARVADWHNFFTSPAPYHLFGSVFGPRHSARVHSLIEFSLSFGPPSGWHLFCVSNFFCGSRHFSARIRYTMQDISLCLREYKNRRPRKHTPEAAAAPKSIGTAANWRIFIYIKVHYLVRGLFH
jgi:hypothetical protein